MLIYVDFCWILGFKLGAKRMGWSRVEGTFFALGAKMGPRAPKSPPRPLQEAPKSLQEPSKTALGTDLLSLVDSPGAVAGLAEGSWIRRPRRGAAVWNLPPELSESSILVSIDN